MKRVLLTVCIAATATFATSAGATITGYSVCTGANSCEITTTPPDPVTQNPNDGILLGWDEKQNITLTADLHVDRVFDTGASFVEADPNGGFIIKAGTIVSSHYFQWDPGLGSASTVGATIDFDSQIFAFITADQKLFDSDEILGLDEIDYNDFTLRGLEPGDSTAFSGPSVSINWTASSPGDWTRLITAYSPAAAIIEPAPAAILGFAILGLGLRRKRLA